MDSIQPNQATRPKQSKAGARTSSERREKRRMAQRDWMGSMIFEEVLQASAKRVVWE